MNTFGGNPLLVQVNATRFDSDEAAKEFFDRSDERSAEEDAANPDVTSQQIAPPPGQTNGQETKWSVKRLTQGDAQYLGVSVSHRKDADYVGIQVIGAPRPPAQNDNPLTT